MAQWSEVWSDPKVAKRDKKAVIMKRANTPPSPGKKKAGGKFPNLQKAGGRNG